MSVTGRTDCLYLSYPILHMPILSYTASPLPMHLPILSYIHPISILYVSHMYGLPSHIRHASILRAPSSATIRQYDIHTRPIPYLIHMNTLSVSIRGVWIPSMVPARFEPICRKAEALRQTCHAACLFDLGFVYPNFSRVI